MTLAVVERATVLVLLLLVAAVTARAQDPAAFYQDNCAACHTIGGGAQAGPDLQGITRQRDREWLVRFLLEPEQMVERGDPLAVKLVAEWDGAVMPATPGLTRPLAEALLAYIEQQSDGPSALTTRRVETPLTPDDVQRGRALFEGRARFEGGTAPCLACHDVSGSRAFGGGTLGPDLTQSFSRLGGRRGLQAWLESPPTPLMRALYRPAPLTPGEARALTAMLAEAPNVPAGDRRRRTAAFGASAAALTVAALGVVAFAWRRRFRSVRRPMVEAARAARTPVPGGTR